MKYVFVYFFVVVVVDVGVDVVICLKKACGDKP